MSQSKYKPGATIPGTVFQYLRTLGEGGQGEVYLVRDTSIDIERVMKVLNLRPGKNAKAHDEAMHEARAIARLKSPHIVTVLSAGMTDENPRRPFFVMEWMEGATLQRSLRRGGAITASEAIEICIQVLDGLSVAHTHPTHPMVHRDIKPANLFIQLEDPKNSKSRTRVVILDFGIARLRDKALSEISSDTFNGTPDYAAPEQYGGLVKEPTDLYAVGGLLFRMLTGRLVYQGTNGYETGEMHRDRKLVAPRLSRFVDVPDDLDDLVAAALDKNPDRRPGSAALFSRWLQQIHTRLDARYREASYSNQATTEERHIEKRVSVIRAEEASLSKAAEAESLVGVASTERDASPNPGRAARIPTLRLSGPPVAAINEMVGLREAPTRSHLSEPAAQPREPREGDTARINMGEIIEEHRNAAEPSNGTLESRKGETSARDPVIEVRVDPRSAPVRPPPKAATPHIYVRAIDGDDTESERRAAGLPGPGLFARWIPRTTSTRTLAKWMLAFALAMGVFVAALWLTRMPTFLQPAERTASLQRKTFSAPPPLQPAPIVESVDPPRPPEPVGLLHAAKPQPLATAASPVHPATRISFTSRPTPPAAPSPTTPAASSTRAKGIDDLKTEILH